MQREQIIELIGAQWKDRYYNRLSFIGDKHTQLEKYFPEVKEGNLKILDVSCGTGVLVEILQCYYKNEVVGLEPKHGMFDRILNTQGVPCIKHDCSLVPYPFEDKSFDWVICISAIDQYRVPWLPVIEEFFRLARKGVFILPNRGAEYSAHKDVIANYRPNGWKQVIERDTYKWTYA